MPTRPQVQRYAVEFLVSYLREVFNSSKNKLSHSGTVWTVSSGARNHNWFRMKMNIGLGV
jgi:hypothetical protein